MVGSAGAPGLLPVNPDWVDARRFPGHRTLAVDPAEPFAANALRIGSALLCSASFPRTTAQLQRMGVDVRLVDMSETEKAEGALTCCSVLFEV